jgi:carbonic anhydrase
MSSNQERNINAAEALQRLKDGNRRFVEHRPEQRHQSSEQLENLALAQWPFAIILGCSDSRVPAEIVFDQGLGDLFVIRVAGNIVAPSQVGSVEFAAASFGTALVVVLGHSSCGAIKATVDSLCRESSRYSEVASAIVSRVMPAVAPLVAGGGDDATLLDRATRANVVRSVEQLRAGSPILSDLCDQGRLAIVGAHYQLDTGEVDFLP